MGESGVDATRTVGIARAVSSIGASGAGSTSRVSAGRGEGGQGVVGGGQTSDNLTVTASGGCHAPANSFVLASHSAMHARGSRLSSGGGEREIQVTLPEVGTARWKFCKVEFFRHDHVNGR